MIFEEGKKSTLINKQPKPGVILFIIDMGLIWVCENIMLYVNISEYLINKKKKKTSHRDHKSDIPRPVCYKLYFAAFFVCIQSR